MDRFVPPVADPLGTRGDVARLERILRYLLLKGLRGERLRPGDAAIRAFLDLPEDVEPDEASVIARLGAEEVVGRIRCPKCGSTVEDRAGVVDERCPICGAAVGSER